MGGGKFNHLIYPLPNPKLPGLGTHLTMDLAGNTKFGPNSEWITVGGVGGGGSEVYNESSEGVKEEVQESEGVKESEIYNDKYYRVAEADTEVYESIRRYYPGVGRLVGDYAGIRPKIELLSRRRDGGTDGRPLNDPKMGQTGRTDGRPLNDFLFLESPNVLHLLGIESPGITASLAIANEVKRLLIGED